MEKMETAKEIQKANCLIERHETMARRKIAKRFGYNDANMKNLTCHFPSTVIEQMDELVRQELFANRSEFMRFCVMNTLLDFQLYLKEAIKEPEEDPSDLDKDQLLGE